MEKNTVDKAILDLIIKRIEDVQHDVNDVKYDVKKLLEFTATNKDVRADVEELTEFKAKLIGASAFISVSISFLFDYFMKR